MRAQYSLPHAPPWRGRALPRWMALLLLACGNIEPNPGPTSNLWQSALAALGRGLPKPPTACLRAHDGRIKWATYNIGGPSVDWDRWMTIVQLLDDMQLDIVVPQEVNPTFPNITSATPLTFAEWQTYYNPHPNGDVNGVAILVKNTLDSVVKRGLDKAPELFRDTQCTMPGITVNVPDRKPLRVLNMESPLHTIVARKAAHP